MDDFLEKLKPLADGKTVVPLKDHIQDFVLDVVSKVSIHQEDRLRVWSKICIDDSYISKFSGDSKQTQYLA